MAKSVGNASFGQGEVCNYGFVWVDTTYVTPTGNVTSFSYQTGFGEFGPTAGQQLDFKVLRETAPDMFTVVGSSGVKTLQTSKGAVETFTLGTPIAAQKGDLLGFWIGSTGLEGCYNPDGSEADRVGSFNYPADPGVGATFLGHHDGGAFGHLNVAATVIPAGLTCNGKTPTIEFSSENSPQTINGTAGDDVIYGGNGADTIDGGGGNDTICGVGGDDVIRGGAGDDYIFGGPGNDDLGGQGGNDTVVGGAGNDRVNGGEGNDKVAGGDGMDIANGGDGDDSVNGGADDDVLAGNAGNDVCVGNQGSDRTTVNGGCERFDSATVSNNTPATSAAADRAVVASAEDPDEANGNAAALMPAGTANSGLDVAGGNSTPFGDGV
jgi:Ca2+-binding RTX toxin-like protein